METKSNGTTGSNTNPGQTEQGKSSHKGSNHNPRADSQKKKPLLKSWHWILLILIIVLLTVQIFNLINKQASELKINGKYIIANENNTDNNSAIIDLKNVNTFEKEIIRDYLDVRRNILVITAIGKYLVISLCIVAIILFIQTMDVKYKKKQLTKF